MRSTYEPRHRVSCLHAPHPGVPWLPCPDSPHLSRTDLDQTGLSCHTVPRPAMTLLTPASLAVPNLPCQVQPEQATPRLTDAGPTSPNRCCPTATVRDKPGPATPSRCAPGPTCPSRDCLTGPNPNVPNPTTSQRDTECLGWLTEQPSFPSHARRRRRLSTSVAKRNFALRVKLLRSPCGARPPRSDCASPAAPCGPKR